MTRLPRSEVRSPKSEDESLRTTILYLFKSGKESSSPNDSSSEVRSPKSEDESLRTTILYLFKSGKESSSPNDSSSEVRSPKSEVGRRVIKNDYSLLVQKR